MVIKMEYSIEEFDRAKSKVMNYIMYKKRTEYEVKNKFSKTLDKTAPNIDNNTVTKNINIICSTIHLIFSLNFILLNI